MATTPVSPKVTSAAAVGSIVGLFLSFANAATPDTFAALGKWSYPAFLALSLGAAVLAAWWKGDPLRQAPAEPAPAASPADAPTAPASTYPAAAVAAAEAAPPAEVTPIIPA